MDTCLQPGQQPVYKGEGLSADSPAARPTPDYGTLGPGSDIATSGANSTRQKHVNLRPALTVACGVLLAVFVGSASSARAAWRNLGGMFSPGTANGAPNIALLKDKGRLDRLPPQKQAERLLEIAIGNDAAANAEIAKRVDRWRGKIGWDDQISALTSAALNSNDIRVRESGLEVQLAAYGLAKNSATVDVLIETAASADHARKIWALWALGALANRGIETARAEQVLAEHLHDADEDSRRWAVEALTLVGTSTTVVPLLEAMHNDPSRAVRERAACGLAESGMLSHEQRMAAVPQLVNYTEDASLDSQTQAWAFQALGDITKERLPNDSAAWRSWYSASKGE